MALTCGVFVFDITNKLLICKPLGIKTKEGWTIPKGKRENNETPIDAAIRECIEEAGIDLTQFKKQFIEIGTAIYKSKKKRLHAFVVHVDYKIKASMLKCVVHQGDEQPEIVSYEMVSPDEAIQRIHYTQATLLVNYLKTKK